MTKRQTKRTKPRRHWSELLYQCHACNDGVQFAKQFETPAGAFLAAAFTYQLFFFWALEQLLGTAQGDVLIRRIETACGRAYPHELVVARIVRELDLLPNIDDIKAIAHGKIPWSMPNG